MRRLVLASRNVGKLRELQALLDGLPFTVCSSDDFPDIPEIEETGTTFEENACAKALKTARITGCVALSDDSGIEVDVLNGGPGVHSARYAGDDRDDEANNQKLLRELEGVPLEERGARYRCVVAVADPESGILGTTEGKCEGIIGFDYKGSNGFGYDPLFIVEEFGCTMAELDPATKNRISHRAEAFRKAVPLLKCLTTGDGSSV